MSAPESHVALLRGINVGGAHIVEMGILKREFEGMGFAMVRTYINSGNVVFRAVAPDREALRERIERTLAGVLGDRIPVLVRSRREIEDTIAHVPPVFDDPAWKHNVIFLSPEIDSPDLLARFTPKPGIEVNSWHPGVLFWSARWDAGTRAIMYRLSSRPEYQAMTVRSVGTVRKVLDLMTELDRVPPPADT